MKVQKRIIRVRDVMERNYHVIDTMVTVREALDTMQYPDARFWVVDKGHEDDEYGMLYLSDIARKVLAQDRAPERVNVYEVMAKPLISVDPGMDIRYCAQLFDKFDIAQAPVIENDKLVGTVSYAELVMRGMKAPS